MKKSLRIACFAWVALTGVLAAPGLAQSPNLAKYVPAQDLVFFLEFDGLDAHNAAWTRSALYHLLNDTTLGLMLEDVTRQGLDAALASTPQAQRPSSVELLDVLKRTLRSGFVVGVYGKLEAKPGGVIVLRNGAKNGTRALLERLKIIPAPLGSVAKSESRMGRSIETRLTDKGDGARWWSERDDLVWVGDSSGADTVLAAIDGTKPNAMTHPSRVDLSKTVDGFEPALRAFLDVSKLPIPPAQAKAMGLDGLKLVDYRWGFQDNAVMSVTRIVAPTPRRGLMALLDGPTFDKTTLPPIPADFHSFTVLSAKPQDLFDKFVAFVKVMDPKAGADADKFLEDFQKNVGLDLRRDVLAHLGPKMVFSMKPTGQDTLLDLFFTAQTDDATALATAIDKLTPLINASLQRGGPPNRPVISLRKNTQGPSAGMTWTIDIPPGMLPPSPMTAGLRPTIQLSKSALVIAPRSNTAQALISLNAGRGKRWSPTGDAASMTRRLPSDLVFLSIDDPRDTLPDLIANAPVMLAAANAAMAGQQRPGGKPPVSIQINPDLVPKRDELAKPMFLSSMAISTTKEGISIVTRESVPSLNSPAAGGVAVALLLPAVQAAREAARRAQCTNNLKQIALGMFNYEAAMDSFPPAAILSKEGKPLLSWRVAILPYIEGQALYNKFHLDEPWDSPNNKPLIAQMPPTYLCPSRNKVEPGTTCYCGFAGEGTVFGSKRGVKISEMTDGTSNTILVAEAAKPVIWTKPDDLPFNAETAGKRYGIGSNHPGGANVSMADGSVRFLKSSVSAETLKKLITRNGGEVVNFNDF